MSSQCTQPTLDRKSSLGSREAAHRFAQHAVAQPQDGLSRPDPRPGDPAWVGRGHGQEHREPLENWCRLSMSFHCLPVPFCVLSPPFTAVLLQDRSCDPPRSPRLSRLLWRGRRPPPVPRCCMQTRCRVLPPVRPRPAAALRPPHSTSTRLFKKHARPMNTIPMPPTSEMSAPSSKFAP